MTDGQAAHRSPYALNELMTAGVIGAGLLFAVYLGNSIGSTERNPLSTAIRLLLPVVIVYSAVWPKQGLYLLLFETAYLDLLKRLMVIFGDITKDDISVSLAAAPLTLASICIGLMVKRALRKREVVRNENHLIALVLGLLAIVAFSAFRSDDDMLGKLQRIAESGSYTTLIFVIPVLLPSMDDFIAFVRKAIFIYLPVALYGLWQYFFGIADFEYTYMLTGLSVLIKEVDDVKPRIFSTLNSNHVFSVVTAFCCAFCFIHNGDRKRAGYTLKPGLVKYLIVTIFAIAVILSLRRTGWFILVLVLAGNLCFKSVIRTAVFYTLSTATVVLLFVKADYIDQNWQAWQAYLPQDSAFQEQAFRIGTFTDRVHSYSNVLNEPDLWSWFGLGRGNQMLAHDALGEALVSYGVVGLAFIAIVTCVGMYQFHLLVFRQQGEERYRAMVMLMSVVTANLIACIVFQSHIVIFPANFFFWLCVGSLFSLSMEARTAEEVEFAEAPRRRIVARIQLAHAQHGAV